jgi:hypothetical protein
LADEPTQTPAPAFSEDALRSQVQSAVRGALTDFAQQTQQQQAQVQQRQVAAQQAQDPIYNQVVRPYVEPVIRQGAIQSQAALDATRFYHRHPEAVRHMDQLEDNFNRLVQQGTPFDHETVWNHFRGQHFEEFAREHQEQMARTVAQGATVGAPGVGRPDPATTLDARRAAEVPFEDLERAVKARGMF